jgi:hypothetical protein
MSSLEELELAISDKITQSVQASPEDALLGFLDIDELSQREVLQRLKNRPALVPMRQYLSRYPAVTCYGLAVAAPIGLQNDEVGGNAIYGAWESAFGYSPAQNEREPLAHGFRRGLRQLGLPDGTIFPDQDFHAYGGCYLFHGAILPHFVEHLRSALEKVQSKLPLPDPDDAERAASFARLLADQVPPGQTRLRKTLESRVGSFLVRRLVRWLLTQDDSLFPPHIKPLLQDQRGRGAFLRSPYLCFDEDEGELRLVLPAQTSGVADLNTRWTVGGRQYRASSDCPPIPLEDLGMSEESFTVTLSQLKNDRENVNFRVQAGEINLRGFLVFDAGTGKERKLSGGLQRIIELPPGQNYVVLLHDSAEMSDGMHWEQAGDARYARIEAVPGMEEVKIQFQGQAWILKPKMRAGLYSIPRDEKIFSAKRVISGSESSVHYGMSPDLICAIPEDQNSAAVLHFSTLLDETLTQRFTCSRGEVKNGMHVTNEGEALAQWMETLPPAVHLIKATLECGGRPIHHEWIHWKGLDRISIYGDFHCSELPLNLQRDQTIGFSIETDSLLRPKNQRGNAVLSFKNIGPLESERWEVPANRVKMTLLSTDSGSVDLPETPEVEVLPNDSRVLQLRFGGLLPVKLLSNGREIGTLSAGKPVISKFLSGLAAEHGRTGSLDARQLIDVPGNHNWKLLQWRTPQTAEECRNDTLSGTPNNVIWLIRKVSLTGIAGLRIRRYNIAKMAAGEVAQDVVDLTVPSESDSNEDLDPEDGFEYSVRRKSGDQAQVRIIFDRETQRGAVWVLDLECLLV